MSQIRSSSRESKLTFGHGWNFLTDYFFKSDEKLVAWLYLIGIILFIVGLVALMAGLSWWSAGFWAVLTAKELVPFLYSMAQFTLLVAGYVGVNTLIFHLISELTVRWRDWLTKKILNRLFDGENNVVDLNRFPNYINNIEQRVEEDVENFVLQTLNLGSDFLKSLLSLGTFIGTLWLIGGSLAFTVLGANIVIPGYLVWVALIAAIIASGITHLIGRPLAKLNQNAEDAKADFRQDLAELNRAAENIAAEDAQAYFKSRLEQQTQRIKDTATKRVQTNTWITAFQSFYMQLSSILPILVSAPLFFSGVIDIGQLMQINMAFLQVSTALSWFVTVYPQLASWKSSLERLIDLYEATTADGLPATAKNISVATRQESTKDWINIKNVTIKSPQASDSNYIMRDINLKLRPGEHTLIQGDSGLGKSTLFKAIKGNWNYGEGKIAIPAGKKLCFLPQEPTILGSTLRDILAYPHPAHTYTDEEYIKVLNDVEKDQKRINEYLDLLDEPINWNKKLSAGNKQKIAFARALLQKPDWLFLDEATASMDEQSEERAYNTLQTLEHTTVVSIAHRSTVKKHHSRLVFFSKSHDQKVHISEEIMGGGTIEFIRADF